MQDTTGSFAPTTNITDALTTGAIVNEISVQPEGPSDLVKTDAEYVSDYRRQLTLMNVHLTSDYPALQSRVQNYARRIDALEAIVPNIHMLQTQITENAKQIQDLNGAIKDLRTVLDEQKQSLWSIIAGWLNKVAPIRLNVQKYRQ